MEEVKRIGFFRSAAEVFQTWFGNGIVNEIEENTNVENSKDFLKESHEVKEILRGALTKVGNIERIFPTHSKKSSHSIETSKKSNSLNKTARVKEEPNESKAPQKDEGKERVD